MTHTTIYKGENTTFIKKKPSIDECPVAAAAIGSKGLSGRQTVTFNNPPQILAGGTVVSERETEGPVGHYFDTVVDNAATSQKSFESAEIRMITDAVLSAVRKAGLSVSDIDLLLAGDLLNQITSSSYVARDLGIPYMGLYSACSTMSQALAVGACFINAGYFKNVACATASHFATAERQYRYPLEYGAQRPRQDGDGRGLYGTLVRRKRPPYYVRYVRQGCRLRCKRYGKHGGGNGPR